MVLCMYIYTVYIYILYTLNFLEYNVWARRMSMVHGKVVDALEIDPAVVKVATEVAGEWATMGGWFLKENEHNTL